MTYVAITALVLLGLFFIVSGALKFPLGTSGNARVIDSYRIVGRRASRVLAWSLPRGEVALGLLLLTGLTPLVAASAAVLLLTAFSIAMALVLARGIVTSCGCNGTLSSREVRPILIARNVVMIVVVVIATLVSAPAGAALTDPLLVMLLVSGAALAAVIFGALIEQFLRFRDAVAAQRKAVT